MAEYSLRAASEARELIVKLHNSCLTHINEVTSSLKEEFEHTLHLESDLGQWLDVLKGRVESPQLNSAHRDFGLSLYAAASGLYRQAFSSSRSSLEVFIATTYLSASEFKRRQWVSGKLDISWSYITSAENGIYSQAFIGEFCPAAQSDRDEFVSLAKATYRRCSEYIHGNVATSQLLPTSIAYDKEIMREWISLSRTTLLVTLHCFMIRYFTELDFGQQRKVEATLEDNLAHLVSVRRILDLPVERSDS
ncbi:hypothetical protein [Saccharopolyspora sp. NPDC050642]|uniref:hypothetical protein n=1 Tax=Saccharopolyspora sp. NPDC050642 TaxID=3157099 RepID=UPI0033C83A9D